MRMSLRNSIGVRLLRIVFGCYLVITVLVTAVQLYFEYSNVEKRVVTELYNVGRSFENGLKSALWVINKDAINSILAGIQKIDTIVGVQVTNQYGMVEGSIGLFEQTEIKLERRRALDFDGIQALDVVATGSAGQQRYYEYKLDLVYEEFEDSPPQLIGTVYLYADQDTVVERFQNSLLLIVVNAVIKTVALWVIFLYFSRRVLSSPLSDLTQATASLSGDGVQSEEVSNRLEAMAQSPNKNELQQLAHSFLTMRTVILEKMENLSTLNNFALALTQTNDQSRIFESMNHQLSQTLGTAGAVVFDSGEHFIWKSPINDNYADNAKELLSHFHSYIIDSIRGGGEIVYRDTVSLNESNPAAQCLSLLYIPLKFRGKNKFDMWVFGEIHDSRLGHNSSLNEESINFLKVISTMVGETLTSISQRKTIEDQNKNLEQRVQNRTRELAKANKELKFLAVHDPLTGLANRTLFNDRLNHMIEIASRENKQFAVASIDLTEFKQINDTYGHDAGDATLVEIGKRFSSLLRKGDTLARMGGDEFAAIFSGENIRPSIENVLSRLIESLQDAISLGNGESLLASANIGVAFFPDDGNNADVLFNYADIAMYQAKRSGCGYAIFDKEKNSKERDHLQFMYELEHAIEKNQLLLHYQPIMELETGKPISFEVLLRWEHPERGIIAPGVFIPHAERTALIKPMTMWVLQQACKQCAQWHKNGMAVGVSINLSPRIFTFPDLLDQLTEIVEEHQLDPKWIKLEITESTAMKSPEKALSIISSLSERGFAIAIDDFGTGHSSLSYLTKLPIDELKIDRSFLTCNDESSQIVVQTVIDLAHSLNLYVVAEGIEDNTTLEMLRMKGCDAIQGYYICRPNTADVVEEWYYATIEKTSASVVNTEGASDGVRYL